MSTRKQQRTRRTIRPSPTMKSCLRTVVSPTKTLTSTGTREAQNVSDQKYPTRCDFEYLDDGRNAVRRAPFPFPGLLFPCLASAVCPVPICQMAMGTLMIYHQVLNDTQQDE